jgi:hypothetical protein
MAGAYRGTLQGNLHQIAASIRAESYLPERMFPQLRERIGPALDIVVEFSTLGEYRLDADGVLCPASALVPDTRERPASPGVEPRPASPGVKRVSPEREPQLGGAGVDDVARAAVRRIVAGGAAGGAPVATPAARRLRGHADAPRGERRPSRRQRPVRPEQLCLAV